MTHKCLKDGCDIQLPQQFLACRSHWYSVPSPVRDEIKYAWRQFQKAERNDLEVLRLARRRYVAARKAAIECLNGVI